jgi:D-alanyl-D-alanine carboxypeptidase
MALVPSEARSGLRYCVISLAAVAAIVFISSDAADARHHRRLRVHSAHHHTGHVHHEHAEGYSPPSASIVVDGNSGQVLQAANADAQRHPASLTKIMTLYLLFERLDAGKLKLDSQLTVSQHAADQDPTKLDLKPGSTIAVEDAIKGVVTRSANDAAVVIAENLGGSEDNFAKLMTQKAHALGMSRTTYVNASGLPDDDQVTTARDQALLGRAIQERYPRYYKYFSTPSFTFHGETIRTHDHLLGSVDGVDGIKTGFTRASGFNLVTSLHRDGRYLVAVVLGGRSSLERDAHMRELISGHFKEASLRHTAPMIAEQQAPSREDAQATAFAKATLASRADPMPTAAVSTRPAAGATDPIQPLLVKTVSYRIAPVQTASLAPMPTLVPVAAAPTNQPPAPPSIQQQATPQAVARTPSPAAVISPPAPEAPRTVIASAEPTAAAAAQMEAPKVDLAKPELSKIAPAVAEPAKPQTSKAESARPALAKAEPTKPEPTPSVRARGGWLIQIGAYEGEDEAKQHLSAAQTKVHDLLGTADPFTERTLKGSTVYYRARFAGFDKTTADAACKQLKRNDFDCMTVKN